MDSLTPATRAELDRLLERRLQETLDGATATPRDYVRDAVYSMIMSYFQNPLYNSAATNKSLEEHITDILKKQSTTILFLAQTVADFTSDPVKAVQALREPERQKALQERAAQIVAEKTREIESELTREISKKRSEMMDSLQSKAQEIASKEAL